MVITGVNISWLNCLIFGNLVRLWPEFWISTCRSFNVWFDIGSGNSLLLSPGPEITKKVMLNAAEHEILNPNKYKNIQKLSIFQVCSIILLACS